MSEGFLLKGRRSFVEVILSDGRYASLLLHCVQDKVEDNR
jgi:hypothetical protein